MTDQVTPKGGEFLALMKYFTKKWALAVATFVVMVSGVAPLLMNLVMGQMMNLLSSGEFTDSQLISVIGKLVGAFLTGSLLFGISYAFRSVANPAFMVDIRRELYASLMQKDMSYYDQKSSGALVGCLSEDVTVVSQIYLDRFMLVTRDIVQFIGGMILSLMVMWQVALPACVVVVLCGVVYIVGEKCLGGLWVQLSSYSSEASAKAEESISAIRTVKSFDCETREMNSYRETLGNVERVYRRTSFAQGVKDGVIWGLVYTMVPGILYFGSWFVMQEKFGYESGDLMVLMMSLIFSALGISSLLTLSDDFKKANVSAAKILDIINDKPKVNQECGGELHRVVGKIEFVDVGFKYETSDVWAVRHLSFTINPGETVAFVGESGSGKTTTLQLLQRLYEIQEGQILLDDVDIKTMAPRSVRAFISVVPQGPVLFSMSVKDNIRFSKRSATDDEVTQAAQLGNAHDFIMEIPENYDAMVQQTTLSGGQKQRICISRAILAHTPILLLDEATASLDTESEQLVQQSIEQYRHGRTVIIVAHRLATVVNADKILVFQDGHVIEQGNHQELLDLKGVYAKLVSDQLE